MIVSALSLFDRFDSKDRRQMTRNLLPGLAFVDTAEDRAAVGAEINSRRIATVTRHGLTQNGEEAALLRQALPHRLPALAAVARSPHRRGGVGRESVRPCRRSAAASRSCPDRADERGWESRRSMASLWCDRSSSGRHRPSAKRHNGSAGRARRSRPARGSCCGRNARSRRRAARRDARRGRNLRHSRGDCGAPMSPRRPRSQTRRPPRFQPRAFSGCPDRGGWCAASGRRRREVQLPAEG